MDIIAARESKMSEDETNFDISGITNTTYRRTSSLSFLLLTSDFHPTTMASSSFSSSSAVNPRLILGNKLSTADNENLGLSFSFFSSSCLPPPKTEATPSASAACRLVFLGSVFSSVPVTSGVSLRVQIAKKSASLFNTQKQQLEHFLKSRNKSRLKFNGLWTPLPVLIARLFIRD